MGKEIRIKGISLSSGIVWGKALFLSKRKIFKKKSFLQKNEIDQEILRYQFALSLSRQDVTDLQHSSAKEKSSLAVEVLETHLELLSDPSIIAMVEEKIRTSRQRTETAFENVIEEYQNRFRQMDDLFFRQRVQDIEDVAQRVLNHLSGLQKKKHRRTFVICAQEIFPSDAIESKEGEVAAFVTMRGGYNSHAAIIARSRSIPYVSEIDFTGIEKLDVETILVDATSGYVIFNPAKKTLQFYEKKIGIMKKEEKRKEDPEKMVPSSKIACYVNIETVNDLDKVSMDQIAGVGIFRTEFLLLSEKGVPSLPRQVQIYSQLAKKLDPKPLAIRLFDLGADKNDLFFRSGKRQKAALEMQEDRGIRFLLKNPKILEDQLLAILEASQAGNVHLLLPFVSGVEEVLEVKVRLEELRKKGFFPKKKLPLGSMIEVPAAALTADLIAKEVDFLSIGTNDLLQYLFASDRRWPIPNPKKTLQALCRVLQMIVESARLEQKPVILCGEMAASPEYLPFFLGIGIERFSLSTFHLSAFRKGIQALNLDDLQKKTEEALVSL